MPADLPETVLQFGTGKFLRCFADLFVHEANQGCAPPVGLIVAVQSTDHRRAALINRQQGRYCVAIRGLAAGQEIRRTLKVESLARAVAADRDWPAVLELARSTSLRLVISNTTEAGLALHPEDRPHHVPPRSFPAKLLMALRARFTAGHPGLTILPCELVEGNAQRLRALVVDQASRWDLLDDAFRSWLERECVWLDTLVDRIVSAPPPGDPLAARDPLCAMAEPYASWLIQGSADLGSLAQHPAVRMVDDLQPYVLRKVRILNGAHTALVAKARPLELATVREAVADARLRAWLEELLFSEIVPTISDRTEGAEQFARDVLERFANPFLDHRLEDIALHHDVKLGTRLVPTRDEYCRQFGKPPRLLDEILASSRSGS